MTESESLDSKLQVYLSLLSVTFTTKRIHEKAISGILPLLFVRDREAPIEDDYDDYRYYLQIDQKKSVSAVDYAISCVKRFFAWLAENPNCTSIKTVNTLPEQRPRTKRARRVSTMLSAYLYESLEILANHDCTDIPTILNSLVSRYVAHREHDIDIVKSHEFLVQGEIIALAGQEVV